MYERLHVTKKNTIWVKTNVKELFQQCAFLMIILLHMIANHFQWQMQIPDLLFYIGWTNMLKPGLTHTKGKAGDISGLSCINALNNVSNYLWIFII